MPTVLILVNGLPGSGKTTLALALGSKLSVPVIAKDAIKEAVADALKLPVEIREQLGAASMEFAWTLAAAMSTPVILESWWFKPRDLVHAQRGVSRCGSPPVVEIWCDLPSVVARARAERRDRHVIHQDSQSMTDNWADWSQRAAPLGIGRTITVDTAGVVDVDGLAGILATVLAEADGAGAPTT